MTRELTLAPRASSLALFWRLWTCWGMKSWVSFLMSWQTERKALRSPVLMTSGLSGVVLAGWLGIYFFREMSGNQDDSVWLSNEEFRKMQQQILELTTANMYLEEKCLSIMQQQKSAGKGGFYL